MGSTYIHIYRYIYIYISNQTTPLNTHTHPSPSHSDDTSFSCSPASSPFWVWPFFGPLLFENQTSDARDHCANERTFLSYLRLSIYMAVVSVAIVLSFHLKNQPSAAELAMSRPLGVVFWLLSVACLLAGLGNYIGTSTVASQSLSRLVVDANLMPGW